MSEQWRQYRQTVYEISNFGNVRRADGRLKKPSRSSNKYLIFGCFEGGKRTNVLVHRAVAECFLGECPVSMEVNHKDGNKVNNTLANLEYVTRSENSKHAFVMGLSIPPTRHLYGDEHWSHQQPERLARGDNNGSRTKPERLVRGEAQHNSKLTEANVRKIRALHDNGMPKLEIAAMFGVSRRNVSAIVNRQSWRHVND